MDAIMGLLGGFAVGLTPVYLFYCVIGVLFGILIGILPGIGATSAIALLLPFSFQLDATAALIMFCGVYCGSRYSGSVTAILFRLPGDPAAVITCVDGYAMTQRGKASAALILGVISSFIAGTLGLIGLTLFSLPLANLMLKLGPLEYLMIALAGIIILAKTCGRSAYKTVLMVLVGLMLSNIGTENVSSYIQPNTIRALEHGIDVSLIAMGLFGVSEILKIIVSDPHQMRTEATVLQKFFPSREEYRRSAAPVLRGGLLGFFFGVLPGPAATISTFLSYAWEKTISRYRAEFGHGAVEGVVSPEAASNAAVAGTMVPSFALGLPFSSTSAIILSGLLLHGVSPGPMFIEQHAAIYWSAVASMYIGNFIILLASYPLVVCFVQILRVPVCCLAPIILTFTFTCAYTIHHSVFDVFLVIIFGLLGYFISRAGYGLSPLLIGYVIGPEISQRLTQTLCLGQSNGMQLVSHPAAITVFLAGTALVLLTFCMPAYLSRLQQNQILKR